MSSVQLVYADLEKSRPATKQPSKKLRREVRDKGGNVLPPSVTLNRSNTASSLTTAGPADSSTATLAAPPSTTGESSAGSNGGGGAQQTQGNNSGKLKGRIERAKKRTKDAKDAVAAARTRKSGELSPNARSNLWVDEDGNAHDSEYVQFRNASPYWAQQGYRQTGAPARDDDASSSASASSSSAASSASGFPSSPYTYTSTNPTTESKHSSKRKPHMSGISPGVGDYSSRSRHQQQRPQDLAATSHLSVPKAPNPRRPGAYPAYGSGMNPVDRLNGQSNGIKSSSASSMTRRSGSTPHKSTSSYQPPAPNFATPRPTDFESALRVPSGGVTPSSYHYTHYGVGSAGAPGGKPASVYSHSLADSTARMTLSDGQSALHHHPLGLTMSNGTSAGSSSGATAAVGSGTGYNVSRPKYPPSTRPAQLDGSALDAGVHGMKRSWDGFKLEMRFGVNKVSKRMSRSMAL